jgi:hypothetical protein
MQDHCKASTEEIKASGNWFFEQLLELTEGLHEQLRTEHNVSLTPDSWSNSADVIIVAVMLRYAAHRALHLTNTTKIEGHRLTPNDMKAALQYLIGETFDIEVKENQEFLKRVTDDFINMVRDSQLTKKVEVSEKNFRNKMRDTNEKLENEKK